MGWGELYILGCVASWVSFSLIGKAVMGALTPLASICYASLIGTAALLPAAWLEGIAEALPGYTLADWLSIGYLGFFGTVLGFVWYYQGIQRIGPTKAGLFINFVPISAILLAFFLLSEPITASLLVGALLVTTGVYMTNRPSA